jgi:hypothetical protein
MQSASSVQITHDNHFVPRGLLKYWSDDKKTIYSYSLLVAHPSVPIWESKPIRGTAFRRDLYTSLEGELESDEVEKWLAREFEEPAFAAIENVVKGEKLKRSDWQALVALFVLQEIRTPSALEGFMRRWANSLPSLIEDTLHRAVAVMQSPKLLEAHERRNRLGYDRFRSKRFSTTLRIDVERGESMGTLAASVTTGRALWLWAIEYMMDGKAIRKLLSYRWSILEAADGQQWPITDHPTLRVRLSDYGVSFGAGIGVRGTILCMPLTPTHLLYAEVGGVHVRRMKATRDVTQKLSQLIVTRGHRTIFAKERQDWIQVTRPRTVSASAVEAEGKAWATWHRDNVAVEAN